MTGAIGILNVGAGDTKIVFDPANPDDMRRAAEVVSDMLARGYALMIDAGDRDADGRPVLRRATGFDPATCEYIVRERREETSRRGRPRGAANPSRRIKASGARGVAVARTAGG